MSGGRKCLPALEDYYECLHHKKEVSQPPLRFCRITLASADGGILGLAGENKGVTARIQESRSCAPEGTCAKGGHD